LNENVIGNKEKSWSGSAGDQRAGKTARQHQVSFDLRHSDNASFVVRPLPERSHERPHRPWCTSSWATRTRITSNIASSLFVRLGRRARAFHVGHRRSVFKYPLLQICHGTNPEWDVQALIFCTDASLQTHRHPALMCLAWSVQNT
jgi:hypothetical protein